MHGGEVEGSAAAAFARRLEPDSAAPLAVALSGGGDSLALLHLAAGWARVHGRRLIALTVDHGLQAASAGWTAFCAKAAAAVGADFRALSWEGEKPVTGIPAAARAARHALLADAARDAGASVILMGHTADDLMETVVMRMEGSNTPWPGEWSPSPAWPQGRGVFVLRPLLQTRRSALRDYLREARLSWIEDPANENPDFARARARARLALPGQPATSFVHMEPMRSPEPEFETLEPIGCIVLKRDAHAHVLAAACLCVSGTTRPPRGEKLARLQARLAAQETFVSTLAGARIEAAGERVLICRNIGERRRSGLPEIALSPCTATVWDGRYEITLDRPGWTVRALSGLQGLLSQREKAVLKGAPAAARGALPALVHLSGTMICPILAEAPDVRIRALPGERFRAAIGLVERENRA